MTKDDEIDYTGLRDIASKQLNKTEKRNEKSIALKYQNVLLSLDHTLLMYSLLLVEARGVKKDTKVSLFVVGALTAICNNILLIKKVFSHGYQLQLNYVLRAQYELLNVLLALLIEQNFFEYFTRNLADRNEINIPTPKPKFYNKILKNHFKKSDISGYLKIVHKILYDEFSKSSHANLLHLVLYSTYEEGDYAMSSLGGSSEIYGRTKKNLYIFNDFSQLIWPEIYSKLVENELVPDKYKDMPYELLFETHMNEEE